MAKGKGDKDSGRTVGAPAHGKSDRLPKKEAQKCPKWIDDENLMDRSTFESFAWVCLASPPN